MQGGICLGSASIEKARKKAHAFVVEYEDTSDDESKILTFNNPTSFVKALLSENHPMKRQRHLDGWSLCYNDRLKKSLHSIKQEIMNKSVQTVLEDGAAPEFIVIDDDELDDGVCVSYRLPVLDQLDTERQAYTTAVERLKRSGEPLEQFQRMRLDLKDEENSILNCIAAGSLGMTVLGNPALLRRVRSVAAATQTSAADKKDMESGVLSPGVKEIQALATGLEVDITVLELAMLDRHQLELHADLAGISEALTRLL
jgi:hypothetical protein